MDKSEYWILNILIEAGCVMSLLDPGHIEWHFSPGHGLDRETLADTLDRLFQRGDLIAEKRVDGCEEAFVPTRSEIVIALTSSETDTCIYLTPQGGASWEELSAPNWNRYIGAEWGEDNWWGASSTNRRLVEKYLSTPKVQSCFIPGSEVWDNPIPFQATYWKTLPMGYRVRFRLLPDFGSGESNPWPQPEADWYSIAKE